MQVPVTVQAVLAARIDRLPPEEKSPLQTAAVIGTEAPLALLDAVAEAPLRLGHAPSIPQPALHDELARVAARAAAKRLYEYDIDQTHWGCQEVLR